MFFSHSLGRVNRFDVKSRSGIGQHLRFCPNYFKNQYVASTPGDGTGLFRAGLFPKIWMRFQNSGKKCWLSIKTGVN